jgi:hypothetical protein
VTNILVASVAVAWLAIILLVLGYAGLVRQVRELQERGGSLAPSSPTQI